MMQPMHRVFIVTATLVLSALIVACGGGGGGGGSVAGGGIGGTGVTSGTITGFGSVFVNGIEFETEGATRDVDDEIDISDGSDDDTVLGIGMVVTIIGTVNDDGVTGTADRIVYDDEVEGPVTDEQDDGDPDTRTFNIFDVTVVIGRTTTVFASTDYDGLSENDLLEVSGYFGVDGKLLATRVEGKDKLVPGVSEVEVKGEVTRFDSNSSSFELLGLDGITITFDNATVFEDLPDAVTNGQFVEVKGTVFEDSIFASRIELEEEGFGYDVDRISVEGIVTEFTDITNFRVSGQRVNASSAAFDPSSLQSSLTDGDRVEVEGSLVDGILQAREVELED